MEADDVTAGVRVAIGRLSLLRPRDAHTVCLHGRLRRHDTALPERAGVPRLAGGQSPSDMTDSPDETIEQLRMALAEAGYPDANVQPDPWRWFTPEHTERTFAVWWMAIEVVVPDEHGCWACYSDPLNNVTRGWFLIACRDGNCAHPDGPARPPRHLLDRPDYQVSKKVVLGPALGSTPGATGGLNNSDGDGNDHWAVSDSPSPPSATE